MVSLLVKNRLKGVFSRQTQGSKSKKSSKSKKVLMIVLFLYVAIVLVGMFGGFFKLLIEPLMEADLQWLYFAFMSIIIFTFCFIGSVFLTQQELYNAKDNDLLLSLPLRNRDILLSRIFLILFFDYIYELLIAIPAFVVYIYYAGMMVSQIIAFIVVIVFLPFLVMAVTSIFSWLVALLTRRMTKKNLITLVLSLAFFGGYMYLVNRLQTYIQYIVINSQTIAASMKSTFPPLYYLSTSISDGNILSLLLFVIFAIVPFGLVVYLLSVNFVKLATTKPKVKKVAYVEKPMKQTSQFNALLKREVKHFTSNPMVMLNGSAGILFTVMLAVILIIQWDQIKIILQMPGINQYIVGVVSAATMSINSMNNISASIISLEGNRLWIIKSLPLETKMILKSKLALHLIAASPSFIILPLILIAILNISVVDGLVIMVCSIVFAFFVALFGLNVNLWKPKFDWINETVCVKQSMSVFITMFSLMAISAFIIILYVAGLSKVMSIANYTYICISIFVIIDILLYYLLETWGVRKFESLNS